MKFSNKMLSVMGSSVVANLEPSDLLDEYKELISEGWFISDGALLLRGLYDSYFGQRARFQDVTSYEVAVNGRGIPDDDIVDMDIIEGTRVLLRRGAAFAWEALFELRQSHPGITAVGLVSVSPILLQPDEITGNVTFYSPHEGETPFADIHHPRQEIALSVESDECTTSLSVHL